MVIKVMEGMMIAVMKMTMLWTVMKKILLILLTGLKMKSHLILIQIVGPLLRERRMGNLV